MRALGWLLPVLLGGCAHRFVECHDTASCRAQVAEREREFAREVAREPPAVRLDVEPVSRLVLVDRQRRVVYVLDPGLVALELETGALRWEAPGVVGDSLWRVGTLLAVTTEGEKLPSKVTFVDPQAPARPVPCRLSLGAPKEAVRAYLHLFDRAGQPYVYWRSDWTYRGGTPPNDEAEAREAAAQQCGVLRLEPTTCQASVELLEHFLWEPPEGRRKHAGETGACGNFSPLLDLPAAAASAPRLSSVLAVLAPATPGIALRVLVEQVGGDQQRCRQVSRMTLEARGEAGALLWTHPLQERQEDVCGPP